MSKTIVYSGCYQTTNWSSDLKGMIPVKQIGKGKGITRAEFNPKNGSWKYLGVTECLDNPSVMCVSPNKKYLYVGNETKNLHGKLGAGGGVCAFKINQKTGELTFINQVSSCGTFCVGVVCDVKGKYVIVANHSSYFSTTTFTKTKDGEYEPHVHFDVGTVTMFRIRKDGGLEEACDSVELTGIGYDVMNQCSAHPHHLAINKNDYIVLPSKGSDRTELFKIDRKNDRLIRKDIIMDEPNSAPRHCCFHPTLPYFFVVNEFDNRVCVYHLDEKKGKAKIVQRIFNVPPQFVGKSYVAGEIVITPDGKYVYCTANTYHTITGYRFDEKTGKLSLIGSFVDYPGYFREMNITPDGKYLIAGSGGNDTYITYSINPKNGQLIKIVGDAKGMAPSCVKYVVLD